MDATESPFSPITHQWLRTIGFRRSAQPANSNILSLYHHDNYISIELAIDGDQVVARTAISDGDVSVFIPAGLYPKNRVDVLRLCIAFGFPFNRPEPENERKI